MNIDGSGGLISKLNIAGKSVIGLLVYLFQETCPWMVTQKGHLSCSLLRNGIST